MTLDRPSVPGKDPFTLCVHLCDFTAGEIVFHYRASSQQNSAERFFENIEWEQQTMIAACIWQYSSNQLLINWVLGPLSRSWKVPWEDNEVCYLPSCVVFHWILSTVFFFLFWSNAYLLGSLCRDHRWCLFALNISPCPISSWRNLSQVQVHLCPLSKLSILFRVMGDWRLVLISF